MTTRLATEDEIAHWDEYITKNPDGGNVFQSAHLAETKRANGWTPRYIFIDSLAVTVLEKPVLLHGKFWYLPKGPGVTDANTLLPLLPVLKDFAASQGVFAVKIEPEIVDSDETKARLLKSGLVRTRAVQPNVSTVVIDLSPTREEIMAAFNQKGRHAIHRAERDGVSAKPVELTEENMKIMFNLLTETAAGRFESSIRSYEYYKKFWQNFAKNGQGSLFFAYLNGDVVAAAYSMYLGKKGLYKDGASVREKPAYGASHRLQWEIMQWMKQQGVKSYDLCGAPHSSEVNNPGSPFYGIGRFKTSFNKYITDYIGCYDLIVNPAKYKLWQRIGRRLSLSLSYRLKHQQWF